MDEERDLSQLDDEEGSDESTELEANTDEQNSGEENDSQGGDESGDAEEGAKSEDEGSSRRQNKRIAQLIDKLRDSGASQQPANEPSKMDYRQTIEAGEDVYKTLETDREKYAEERENLVREETKWDNFTTKLEIDATKVYAKYPVLDPESDAFDPAVAADINVMYLSTVGAKPDKRRVLNPGIRYHDFIDAFMGLTESVATAKNAESVKNITKQSSKSSIKPGGVMNKGTKTISSADDIANMSQEEWDRNRDKYLAQLGITKK